MVNGGSKAEERGPSVSRVSRSGGSSSSSHKRAQRAAKKRDGNSYFSKSSENSRTQLSTSADHEQGLPIFSEA